MRCPILLPRSSHSCSPWVVGHRLAVAQETPLRLLRSRDRTANNGIQLLTQERASPGLPACLPPKIPQPPPTALLCRLPDVTRAKLGMGCTTNGVRSREHPNGDGLDTDTEVDGGDGRIRRLNVMATRAAVVCRGRCVVTIPAASAFDVL
ncbi:hypothetical protein CC85DRAFT_767 [Cutaneotrichosporon oleaginosum]|uniref:Uncharacterized protein n=1 Tax=Cutaneotrichosporon oleaginosum TaxID=879819 RepID=A0A0J1BE59_9TREE|nr:uncharacterized protein CC85DRAFT_767 [Cutaneotrichosporon oleaginosum]KLT46369.1 hypothetical protein CC85DRAFT_767 [Cutaneotrichosporon oleaginosum]TXT15261.1 hypothetical protein COLE_01454 [Cutaneotrichosporon oleaginosum]